MKYKWKNRGMGVSAQVVGQEITKLEQKAKGALTPQIIVDAARPVRSKLHRCFEWDDTKAAEAYRRSQAGEMLRRIVVVYDDDKDEQQTIRAFVSIKQGDSDRYYTSMARVVDDEDLLENVRDQIAADLLEVKERWKQFKVAGLHKIWQAVTEFVTS
jgi:hypothetical protein